MASDHNFEELEAPAKTAEELHISVATLRKYSLIVEKVTGNKDYYERTKQKSRLYSAKDIEDLKAFKALSKKADLTLQEAARWFETDAQAVAICERTITGYGS